MATQHRIGSFRLVPVLLVFLFTTLLPLFGQDADSIHADSVNSVSPNVVLFRSVLLPGWGQWTNGSVWKTALIFYGELTLAGSAVHFNQLAVDSKDDYMREYYKENRRLYLWWLAAAHLLGILDALVDAHLKDFDVSPDLTIHVQEDKPVCMMGLKLSLSKRSADPHCRE